MIRPVHLFLCLGFCAVAQAQVTIVNGASFRVNQPVSAGSWATAFGTFSGVADTTAPAFPLPRNLGGVTLTVDGIEAPLFFVGRTQVNFLVPYRATPGLRPVVIQTPGGSFNATIRVMTAAPGIFVKDAEQPPRGAIRNQDFAENTPATPARRGQLISIFATGPGALNQDLADGAAAPRDPLALTRSTPQVYIAGVAAQVQFSGLAPDFPGLWQVNAVVPDQAHIAGRVPVQVFMDGVDSNEVTIFVAP